MPSRSRFTSRVIAMLVGAALVASACGAAAEPDASIEATVEPVATSTTTPQTTPQPKPEPTAEPAPESESLVDDVGWTLVTPNAPWAARAGLRVLASNGSIFLLGGRTPKDSTIPGDSWLWSDVWRTDDRGATWTQVLASDLNHWQPRAYFQAVTKDDELFVMGGQDFGLEPNPFCDLLEQGLEPPPGLGIDPDAPCPEFFPTSQFFNDVWRSLDGVTWEQLSANAPWPERAGLSAAVLGDHIFVLGGSQNDDASIIGENGPERLYFNDVWRSVDGASWELMTSSAPWEPRAGGALVAFDEALYLLGGEDGFTCSPLPDCDAPYFNDVWRSVDGAEWELITESAGWSPRPGHVCKELGGQLVCFGGFGLIENPLDVWSSPDGSEWTLLDGAPWNATASEEAKYDFDALVVGDDAGGELLLTFGGDRETFDFADPENWLRIDNDVWRFTVDQ